MLKVSFACKIVVRITNEDIKLGIKFYFKTMETLCQSVGVKHKYPDSNYATINQQRKTIIPIFLYLDRFIFQWQVSHSRWNVLKPYQINFESKTGTETEEPLFPEFVN